MARKVEILLQKIVEAHVPLLRCLRLGMSFSIVCWMCLPARLQEREPSRESIVHLRCGEGTREHLPKTEGRQSFGQCIDIKPLYLSHTYVLGSTSLSNCEDQMTPILGAVVLVRRLVLPVISLRTATHSRWLISDNTFLKVCVAWDSTSSSFSSLPGP